MSKCSNIKPWENKLTDEDREFLKECTPSIFWNDVDCYYWAMPVRVPSGRLTEVKVSRDGQKWSFCLVPTLKEIEEEKEIKINRVKEKRDKEKTEKLLKEASDDLYKCLKGLRFIELAYKNYF